MSDQLLNFIQQSLTQGQNQANIEGQLLNAGWNKDQIKEAFRIINSQLNKTQVSGAPQQQGSGMKKMLLVVVTLAVGATAIFGGLYGYKQYQTNQSSAAQNSNTSTTQNEEQQNPIVDNIEANEKTWAECASSDLGNDYLPPAIGSYGISQTGSSQEGNFANYTLAQSASGFKLYVLKDSIKPINAAWNLYASDTSAEKNTYFGNEAVILTQASANNTSTILASIVPSHAMLLTVVMSGEEKVLIEESYKAWFEAICKPVS